eukprot:INCI3505.1.p1 GENE.INCI3505.1~~INCI3505.1.p1  ORF type:complete len:546 (+),score=80.09 INCI3505.1:154-1791(+)
MSSQGESGVLLSDVGPGGDDASALAHRLEEAAATGQVQVVSAAEGDLRFRDAECVSDFLTGQRRFSRQARGSDIALVGSEVSLGGGRRGAGQTRFALNRIIGAHVGVTSSGTLFLSFAVHQSQAATHHACVSVHVVFRDSSESGSKSGGASKDDADVDALPALQSSRKVWETWVANLQEKFLGEVYDKDFDSRPSLVLLNPAAAAKDAVPRFEKVGQPYLSRLGVSMKIVVTERPNHASEIVENEDILSLYRSIVVGSGDGMLYEVVQGIMRRPDAAEVIQRVRLAILPLGSGNGLANSLLRDPANGLTVSKKHEHALIDALFLVARNKSARLDLAAVQTHDNAVHWSFLSLEWALFADIDIESEKCRCCGDARFFWWGLVRILCGLRRYHGTFSYLPHHPSAEDPGIVDAPVSGPLELDLLPQHDDDVPGNWETIDDTITQFWACNTTMQAVDCVMAPQAALSDGLWHVTINRNPSCCKMAELTGAFETGSHLDDPETEIFSTRAFRLTPRDPAPPGILAVDGERVVYGAIQVQVFKGLMRVVA